MTNTQFLHQKFETRIPDDDNRERLQCTRCGFIAYENPKIVVGAVACWKNKILLCKRAIDPRKGYWTLPAGYMELNETPEEGAIRESWEEAHATMTIDRVLAIYSVPHISQVQIIYRALLTNPDIAAGPESQAVTLYPWQDIPWADIAFPTVGWALRHYYETREKSDFPPFSNPVEGL